MQVVREKLFKRLYKELPYRLDIKDAGLSIFRDGSIRIEKHVLVHSNQVKTVDIAIPQTPLQLWRSWCLRRNA